MSDRDKFLHNGFPSRQAMLDHLAESQKKTFRCEVDHLLAMPYPKRMEALALREKHRGKASVDELRQAMQEKVPGCLKPPAESRLSSLSRSGGFRP